jgi:uncharacterized tellurite resistance protein B-like protein
MSLWDYLGLGSGARKGASPKEIASDRRIVQALDSMNPRAARYLARFAFVLGRVARADLAVTDEETRVMEQILMERGGLPEEQAIVAVQIAKSQNAFFGGTDDYLVTREFAANATRAQKLALLECCFAVSAADDEISGEEQATLRQIAEELDLAQTDLIEARSGYREFLAGSKPR